MAKIKKIILKTIWAILRAEARLVLAMKKPMIIAITGSVAKTSTKDAIYWILKNKKIKVWKSPGNLNAEIGVPLSILGYRFSHVPKFLLPLMPLWGFVKILIIYFIRYPKVLILEMGVEHKGDIAYFTSLAKPHISVITAIGVAHAQNFKDIDEILEEKAQLISVLEEGDWAVINKKDKYKEKLAKKTSANIKYFDAEIEEISKKAACAVAEIFEISSLEAEEILKKMPPLKGRLNIIKKNGVTIIDDSYNANPLSMIAALRTLDKKSSRRKIAILGDMLELGKYSKKSHEGIGKMAAKCADWIIFIGENADLYKKGAKGESKKVKINKAEDAEEAIKVISEKIKKGDVILVKGSRRIGLEKVVKRLINS